MQPLDCDNAQFRRDAAEMRTATLRQRAGIDEQRARMRVLHEANNALRARLDSAPRA
jgi:hypothetical protein